MLNARSRGFTIVELMITVAVFALLLAAGAPALRTFVENGRIRAAGESMKYGLSLARSEAVRLNTQVEFVTAASGWQVRRVSDGTVLHQGSGKEGTRGLALQITPADSDRVTFDAFGRAVEPNGSDGSDPMTQIDLASLRPPGSPGYRPLRLQLLAGGMSRLCDPNAAADDPRTCL
jgi:type IV fimbrial biogenesis protein FimT